MSLEIFLVSKFLACCSFILLDIFRLADAGLHEVLAIVALQIPFVSGLLTLADFILIIPGRDWHVARHDK